MKTAAVAFALAMSAGAGLSQTTPVGLWKTVDDETKQERSHVRITDQGGVLTGKVEKLLDPVKQDSKCDKCTDERKGQPVVGMTILRDVKANGDAWDGGDILDPANGKVYRVRLKPEDGGKRLEVRGYLGPFYRNQHWIRVE